MRVSMRWVAGAAAPFGFTLLLLGCDSGKQAPQTTAPRGAATSGEQTGGERHDMNSETAEHEHGPALSAADQALADAQRVCPVSGEDLGSMGPPFKYTTAKGETVFLCCGHCKPKMDADPDKYLAKLAELKKAMPEEDRLEQEKPQEN